MSYLYFGETKDYVSQVNSTNNALDVISPSYFDLNADGSLLLTTKYKADFVNEMHKQGKKVVPFLSNHWDKTVGRNALSQREILSTAIANAVDNYNLDGVNIDIEGLDEKDRNSITDFTRLLRNKIPSSKEVSISVAANPSGWTTGWHGSYNYAALSKYVDHLMIMAYDEHWDGSDPGPIASYSFVEKSIQYALKQNVPSQKIVLGLPFFGRIWKTDGPNAKGTVIDGYGVTNSQIKTLVNRYDEVYSYNTTSFSPSISFQVGEETTPLSIGGNQITKGNYVIWYEDSNSLEKKLSLIKKYNLKGSGSWSLGQEDKTIWSSYSKWALRSTFYDTSNHWAEEIIELVNQKKWMTGVKDGYFEPQRSLTREEAITVIVRALNLQPLDQEPVVFRDVNPDHWAYQVIQIGAQHDLIKGIGNNQFGLGKPITREELAVMLFRTLEQKQTVTTVQAFTDVPSSRWSYSSIMEMKKRGILNGYADGSFHPSQAVTRAETAAILLNTFNGGE